MTPHAIPGLRDKPGVVYLAGGCYHSVAVCSNGMIYVCGRNNHGQLGTGDLEERHTPTAIDDFLGRRIESVAAGFYHTIILHSDANERGVTGDSSYNIVESTISECGVYSGHDFNSMYGKAFAKSCMPMVLPTAVTNSIEPDVGSTPPGAGASTAPPACSGRNGPLAPTCTLSHRLSCQVQHEQHRQQYQEQRQHRGSPDAGVACDYKLKCPSVDPSDAIFPCKSSDSMSCSENPLAMLVGSTTLMKTFLEEVVEKHCVGQAMEKSKSRGSVFSILSDELLSSKRKNLDDVCFNSSSDITLHHIAPFLLEYVGAEEPFIVGDGKGKEEGNGDTTGDNVVDKLIDIATYSNQVQWLTCSVRVLTALLSSIRSDIAAKTKFSDVFLSCDGGGSVESKVSCLSDLLRAIQQLLVRNQKLLLTVCSSTPACNCMHCASRIASESRSIADISASDSEPVTILGVLQMLSESRPISSASRTNGRETSSSSLICILKCAIVELRNQLTYTHLTADSTFCGIKSQELLDNILYGHLDSADSCDHCQLGCDPSLTKKRIAAHNDLDAVSPSSANTICNRISNIIVQNVSTLFVSTKSRLDHFEQLSNAIINICRCSLNYGSPNASDYGASELDSCSGVLVNFGQYLRLTIHFCFRYCTLKDIATLFKESVILGLKWFCVLIELFATLSQLCMQYKLYSVDSNNSMIQVLFSIYCGDIYKIMGVLDQHCLGNFTKVAVPLIFTEHCTEVSSVGMTILTKIFTASEGTLVDLLRHHQIGLVHKYYTCLEENALKEEAYAVDSVSAQLESDSYLTYTSLPKPSAGTMSEDPVLNILSFGTLLPNTLPSVLAIVMSFLVTPPPSELLHSTGTSSVNCGTISSSATGMLQTIVARLMIGNIESSEPRKCNVVELDVIEHKLHLMKSMLPLLDSLRNRILKLQRCWNDTRTALVNVVGYMGTLLTEGSESGSRSETPAEGEKVKNACVFISSTLQCAWCSRLLKLSIVTSSNIASILVLSHEISVIQNENESLSGSSEKIMKHPVWSYVSLPDREKDLMPNFGSLFCPVSDSMGMEATRKLYTSSDHVYNMLLKVAARSTTPMTVKIGMDTQVEPVTHLSIIHSIEGMIFDTVCMCEFGSCSLEGVNSVVSESQRSIMQLVKTQAWKGIAGIIKRMYSKRSAIISALQPKSDIGHGSAQESLDAPETGDDIYSTPTRKIRSLKDSSILYTHELSAESPSYFMSPILEANNKNRGTPDSCGLRHSITKSDEVVDSVTPCVKWGDILSIIHAIVKRVHFRLHETSGVLSLKYTFNTPLLPPVVFSKVYKYKSHWKRAFSLIVCCNRWRLLVKHSLRSSLTTSVVSFYDDCITETVYSSLMELETKRSDEAECAITAIEEKMIDSTYVSELVNESWKKNVEDVLDCGNRRCNHVAVGILEYCNLLNSDMNVGVLGAMGGSKSDVLVSLVETFRYKNELKLFAHHMVSNDANPMGTKVCVGDSSRKPCLIYALDRSCCSTLYEHSTYNFGCKQLVRMLQQGVTGVYDMNRPVNGGNNIAPLVIGFQYNNNDLVYVSLCLKALEVMSVYSYDALLSLNMPKLCVDIRGLFLLFEQLSSEALATTSAGAVSTNNNSSGDQENVSKNVSTAPPNVSQKSSASTSAVDLAPAGSPSAPRPTANGQPPASLPTQSREKKKLYRRVSSIIVSFLESLGVAVSYLSGLGGDQAVCQMYAKYLYEAQSVVISSLQKARAVPNNLFSADGSHGNPDANSLSVSQKKRCQTLISNPILFNKGADGFLIPEKSLISNNKGIDFTLVGWVYISKNGSSVSMNSASGKGVSFLFGRMQQNDCWPLLLLRPDMKLEVVYGKSVDLEKFSSNANIPANTWIHVAVTNEARKIKLYINGSLDCHVTVTGNPKAISMPLMIGACPQNIKTRVDYVREGFDGQLGNFKYHTRALTLIHVRILFEQGAPEVNDGRDKWLFQMLASSCLLCRVLRRCNNKVLELSGDVVQKNAHALLNLALSDGYSGSNGCGLLTSTPSSSGGIVMSSTSLGGSSSFTTSMCSSKLRVAALRGLEGILAINILNDIEISTCDLTQVSSSHDSTKSEDCCPIPAIDSQGNFELSTKLPGCSNPGDSSDSKRSPISLMTASFLLEYSTFHEKFVAFIFKLIGLCWLPSVISGTEVSSDLPASLSKAKELSRFLGEHGDCFLEILVCAPKFIASSVFGRDSTTSSNTAGNGVVGSAIDKTVPREDLNSEFCHLMGSMLHALANNVKQGDSLWYNAISSVIEKMLTRCRTALNFRSQWNNSTMVIVDTLGISMFLGNMCTGLYLGCDIEGYFCDGVGKLLHVHPSNGTVTLLQPNRSHTRSQIVTVRLSDVAAALNCNNSASGSESGSLSVRYRTVLAVLDVIDTLSPYLFLIRSDIACIYRPDHPFLRQFFIKALRPVEILISYQLLRYLLFQLDAHPLTDSAKKSEQNLHVDISKRPNLYFLIVQLSGRILHPQGLYDVSDVSRLWVKCARYVSKSLSSECQEVSMPPPDYEKLMMDFTTKQIGLSLPADAFRVVDEEVPGADGFGNAFQSPHNNKLLRMGLFAELVHYCAGGVSDPSKDEPPNEWVYDTLPINNTSSIQDLSEVDYGYMLRLTYNIRRGVILHCRDILLNLLCDAGHIELMMSSLPFSLKMMIFHQLCHMQSIYRKNLVNKGDEYQAASLMEPGVQCNVTIALENVCFYMKKHFMREASSALTSCLRCLSCSFFQSSATKIIGNVLENTDLFSRHLLAAHLWIDYHRNSDYEVELCVSMMKVILSSLMFVESASIELSLLQLCRHALTRILNCAMGVEARCGIAHVHTELAELSLCKSFNDIRCRAVEQLLRERGNANSQYSELTRTVVYIASGLELLQRFTSSAWNLSSPVLPYSSVARTACKTPRPSSAAKIPAASAESEFLASFKPMSPRIVNIKAGSVDIELTQCLNRLHYTLFANKALNLSTDKGNATLIEVALSSQVLPLVNDSRRTHGANGGIVPAADLNHFEVIYRGTCMKITQAGLLPNCIYSVKYRLLYSFYCLKDASTDANSNTGGSATGTSMDSISGVTSWCDAVEFRTDFGNSGGMMHSNSLTNVSFAFDPLRCGPDILLGCDGQTASYAGDDSWSTVLGTHSFTTGIVAWNIRICQSSTAYIFVGAATSTADLHTFLGGCSQSWGFIGEQALYHNREKVKVYGDCFCAGDIVGVVLDLDAGTLSFAINGKLQGVAFEGVFGEFYPAVAFYSVGQEVEIMSEGYQATAANETGLIGCTPGYNNIGDCSLVMEYIMCLYSKYASLSWQLMEELTQQCNLFCNGLQHRVLSVSGKYILLNTDCENSIVLKNLEMKVGERYRTPCGVGCVLGTAYGRVWFQFGDVNKVGGPQVWYYTHQQIVHARGKGFYQKNSYQPWGSVHPAEPDTAFRYDVENMLEILAPGKWTCTMDAAILTYLHKLAKDLSKNGGLFSRKTVPVSPWDVPITVINSEFRHLQSKLGKIVMKNNELLRIWGISGPKRRAVVARIALLRHYNLLLENNMSLFINDSLGSSVDSSPTTNQHIVSLRRSYDDYHPLTTTLWALGSGGNSTAIGSYDSGGDRCTGTSSIAYKQRGSTTIVRSDGHVTWPLVELEWNFPAAAQSVLSSAPSAPTTPQFKYTLFNEVKLDHFWEIVLKSAIKAAKTEDDYDYPDDLPQVKLNRFKSFRAKEASEFLKIPGDDLLFSSLFCQLWAELRQHSQEKVRMIYAHSMDDGQSRAFKVKFESEGVDDYGGPYREIFQQICAELQAADPSSSGLGGSGIDNGSQKKKNTARTNCFIPLLCPIANWSYEGPIEPEPDNCEGFEHRYAYTLNPSCTSDVLMDLYKFLGQFIGMAIRSKITLEFSFPMVMWKSIVRDTLTQKDLIGFDADAYNFISSIGNSYESYCNPHDTEENKGVIREELLTMLQGVCWSCTRTDGEIVELIPNGKQLSVDIEDLPYFIQKYVECRLTESFVALEALRSGLMSVIPEAALSLLTGEELYLIVCGASTIDVERLKLNTEYDDDISPEDPHIIMFWEVLASFSEAEKSSYLRFVWARPTLPPNQMEFVQKMKIQSVGHDDSTVNVDNYLPKAHTCFFSLNLPKYSSKEVCSVLICLLLRLCLVFVFYASQFICTF